MFAIAGYFSRSAKWRSKKCDTWNDVKPYTWTTAHTDTIFAGNDSNHRSIKKGERRKMANYTFNFDLIQPQEEIIMTFHSSTKTWKLLIKRWSVGYRRRKWRHMPNLSLQAMWETVRPRVPFRLESLWNWFFGKRRADCRCSQQRYAVCEWRHHLFTGLRQSFCPWWGILQWKWNNYSYFGL